MSTKIATLALIISLTLLTSAAYPRWLNSKTGRFISRDPIPMPNLYRYADDNPIKVTDPHGLYGNQWDPVRDPIPHSGNVHNPLTPWNYFCAQRVYNAYWEQFGNTYIHDQHDTWLHCVTSCEIARQCGTGMAIVFGRGGEMGNDWSTHPDTQLDEVGNARGRSCVLRSDCPRQVDCDACCDDLWDWND